MKHKSLFVVVVLIVCVALVGTVTAESSGPSAPQAAAGTAFTYQGQIKRNDALFTGTCDMQFGLWDSAAAGTQQGPTLNANAVNVDNGIFAVELDFGNQFKGEARWLESSAKCADDVDFTTMPRVALNPVPYAIGLVPGAIVNGDIPFGSGDATFKATNASASGGTALFGQSTASTGPTAGVYGLATSPDGAGVWGHSISGSGVYGQSTTSPGVSGKSASSRGVYGVSDTFIGVSGKSTSGFGVKGESTTGVGIYGESASQNAVWGQSTSAIGVYGTSTTYVGVWGESTGFEGVRGVSHSANHGGVVGVNDASGTAIYGTTNAAHTLTNGAVVGNSTGEGGIGVLGRADVGTGAYGVYGVSASGYGVVGQSTTGYAGYFIGKVGITGADLAERFAATDDQPIEPGSVVVVDDDQPGKIKVSNRAYDSKVVGIISGAGGIHTALMLHQDDALQGDQVVAIAGRVYCKAEANSNPIKPGDLLTTSSIQGHCMKAADRNRAYGAIIGKALTGLDKGEGLVLVLVNLQ